MKKVKITSNNANNNNYSNNKNSSNQSNFQTFPIWEKVYLDTSECKDFKIFISHSTSIYINKKLYLFPKFKLNLSQLFYAIIDLEKETIQFQKMQIECFNPILDKSTNIIYLYSYKSSYSSDYRYILVTFNYQKNSFNIIQQKGVPPKARMESFTSFILNGKIFFFGGLQMFHGDNSLNYLYSFNIKESEWNIENFNGIYHNDNANLSYIANTYNVVDIKIDDDSDDGNENKIILIGGKYFEDIYYSNLSLNSKIINAKESCEIVEFTSNPFPTFKFIDYITNNNCDVKFNNHCAFTCNKNSKNIYIYNNQNLYYFDSISKELFLLKPRLFSPEIISNSSSMVIHDNYLYLIGNFKCYEDCHIFKTCLDNIINKWNGNDLVSYENLLNVKECSDMACSFNNGDKTKEMFLNKKILFNFSNALKHLINRSQNSNVFVFNDINYITMYNILKSIYSNFNDNLNNLDFEIINEIFYILIRYQAKSLVNIILDKINLNNDNAIHFYELSLKHNLTDFTKKCQIFICQNINNSSLLDCNEGNELRTLLFKNYFCEHKIFINCNISGINIKNLTSLTITNDKLNEIKDLCKDGKLKFCLNCKKVFT